MILLKRIYESPSKDDGYRVLVDRLWPRGLSKEKADVDLWLKDIAPSTKLREWFGHEVQKWDEFEKRYKKELSAHQELINQLKELEKSHKKITLLFGAKDREHNNASVLLDLLR